MKQAKKQTKKPSKKSVAPFITDEGARKILNAYAKRLADEYANTENLLFGDTPTDRGISSRHFDDVRGSLLLCGLHEVCDELQRRHDARSAEWRQFVTTANAAPTEAKEAERKGLYPAGLEGYGDQYEAFWTALETFQRGISADYAFIIVDLLGTKAKLTAHDNGKTYKRHKCAEGLDYKKIAALFSAKALPLIKAGSKQNPIYEKKRGVGQYIFGLVSERTIKEWVKKYPDQYAIHPICGFHAGLLEDKAALDKSVARWESYIRDYATQFYEWRQTNKAAPRSAFRYKPKPPPDALK